MTLARLQELENKIRRTLEWTLRGGNDPEYKGSTVIAVEELGEILITLLYEIFKPTENNEMSAEDVIRNEG